jgi:hypothetical protein
MKNCLRVTIGPVAGYVHRTGEVELSRAGDDSTNAVCGRGRGNIAALKLVWGCLWSWARSHGVSTLYCEPTTSDGRGATRVSVYRRVGFREIGGGIMEFNVKVKRRPT